MKPVLRIVVGIVIALVSWVPISLADRGDIPFGAAILAFVGSFIGGLIALIAFVQWARMVSRQER